MTEPKYREAINTALDRAARIWQKVEPELANMHESLRKGIEYMSASLPSNIPDHKEVNPLIPEVDNFIAFVLDIRKSSEHLLQACSSSKVERLERVLYEITAINTIGSIVTNEKKGSITEFLGDGFLALFKVDENDNNTLYRPHNAAKEWLRVTKEIVNPILAERYNLPPLHIGVGLAYSQAIVTVVGHGDNLHPKALGECVFRASKLSGGHDNVYFDRPLRLMWPKKKGSTMTFTKRKSNKHDLEFYTFDKKS